MLRTVVMILITRSALTLLNTRQLPFPWGSPRSQDRAWGSQRTLLGHEYWRWQLYSVMAALKTTTTTLNNSFRTKSTTRQVFGQKKRLLRPCLVKAQKQRLLRSVFTFLMWAVTKPSDLRKARPHSLRHDVGQYAGCDTGASEMLTPSLLEQSGVIHASEWNKQQVFAPCLL